MTAATPPENSDPLVGTVLGRHLLVRSFRRPQGAGWSPVVSGTDAILDSVWGSGRSAVWAVGDAVVHWDGSAWSLVPTPAATLLGVWGSGPRDVWAVGTSGTILHWDGSAWSLVPNGGTP